MLPPIVLTIVLAGFSSSCDPEFQDAAADLVQVDYERLGGPEGDKIVVNAAIVKVKDGDFSSLLTSECKKWVDVRDKMFIEYKRETDDNWTKDSNSVRTHQDKIAIEENIDPCSKYSFRITLNTTKMNNEINLLKELGPFYEQLTDEELKVTKTTNNDFLKKSFTPTYKQEARRITLSWDKPQLCAFKMVVLADIEHWNVRMWNVVASIRGVNQKGLLGPGIVRDSSVEFGLPPCSSIYNIKYHFFMSTQLTNPVVLREKKMTDIVTPPTVERLKEAFKVKTTSNTRLEWDYSGVKDQFENCVQSFSYSLQNSEGTEGILAEGDDKTQTQARRLV